MPRRFCPRVFAVILNRGTPDLTLACVASLRRSTRQVEGLIVVDNGSQEPALTALAAGLLPSEHLVQSEHNLGFSGGCNLGIEVALAREADAVLLLNSDVVVCPQTLGLLMDALASQGVGIVGPAVVQAGAHHRVESLGIRYARVTGRMVHRGSGGRLPFHRKLRSVQGVSGCAMLISTEVFRAIGLLLEDYFFSFEDLDFCLRAAVHGFRTVCQEQALVFHQGGATIGKRSSARIYYAARNHLLLASRFGPELSVARLARALCITGLTLTYALTRSPVPVGPGLEALAAGVWDHLRSRYGPSA
jgi:GT2 family glycosyltransferase